MQAISVAVTDAVRCSHEDHGRLFDAMVEYKAYLLRVAYSILRHTEDAEDAVQAAYLSAWTGWASFRGQSSLKTWLTTIVMNKALTELRTKRRQTWVSMDGDPALMVDAEWQLSVGQVTPEQQAIREQSVRRVRERMGDLPAQTRGIVILRYVQEMSVEEIARVRGTTQGAVKGHLYRGCKALRVIPKRMQRPSSSVTRAVARGV
jgi:RNA polymerase sigma-70 factor (ECF subfamily)